MTEIPIKCRVILHASTKNGYDEGDICKRIKLNEYWDNEPLGYLCFAAKTDYRPNEEFQAQNIHIISPEKFYIGDVVYDYAKDKVGVYDGCISDGGSYSDHCWKIVASTSGMLQHTKTSNSCLSVVKIPSAFVNEYVSKNGEIYEIDVAACVTGKDVYNVYNDVRTNEIVILREQPKPKITRGMQGYSHGDFQDEQQNLSFTAYTESVITSIDDGNEESINPPLEPLIDFFAKGEFEECRKYFECYKFGYNLAKKLPDGLSEQIVRIIERNVPTVAAHLIIEIIKNKK